MRQVGSIVDECGVIVRVGDQVLFRRELGGRFMLEGKELRDDVMGRRVAILGTVVGKETVYLLDLAAQP